MDVSIQINTFDAASTGRRGRNRTSIDAISPTVRKIAFFGALQALYEGSGVDAKCLKDVSGLCWVVHLASERRAYVTVVGFCPKGCESVWSGLSAPADQ